jgi:outer membrane protein assembly factor BamB
VALSSLPVLAHLSGGPDDAATVGDGSVWISEHDGGHLVHLDAAGTVVQTLVDPLGPEGIVVLPDGTLLVAQQVPNRIDHLDARRGIFAPWLPLGPAPSGAGIDGIGLAGTSVVVPDSHAGRLLTVALTANDGVGAVTVIATGLGRPVDAAAIGDGAYAVTVENQPGLVRVSAGASGAVVHEASLDDVVVEGGVAYVTDLTGRVLAVDLADGSSRVLVSAAPDAQGLTVFGTGLLVVDETADVAAVVPSCS